MDAKLAFWCAALANMAVLCAFVARGVAQARRGEMARHRRSMWTAAALVAAFLVAYLLKASVLGKEDMSAWSAAHVANLRIHESFVLLMLVAGGVAIARARAFPGTRSFTRDPADPAADPRRVRAHRRAGWTAAVSALLGLLTAAIVLAGMIARSG